MVVDSTGGGRHLFQIAPTGRGLASIEDAALRAGHGVGEFTGVGGDSAEALEEVEGDAFAFEQRTDSAADVGDFGIVGGDRLKSVPGVCGGVGDSGIVDGRISGSVSLRT